MLCVVSISTVRDGVMHIFYTINVVLFTQSTIVLMLSVCMYVCVSMRT